MHLAVLVTVVAIAAPSPKRAARKLFQEGRQHASAHRWSEALDAFNASYSKLQSPLTLFNIGYCQRALGKFIDARESFNTFLEIAPNDRRAKRVIPEVNRLRAEIEARLAAIEISAEPDVRVSIDGRPVRLTDGGAIVEVDPGFRTVMAERDGHRPFFADITLQPGERRALSAKPTPLPARLTVKANVEEASVAIDGEPVGIAPTQTDVSPGQHRVSIEAEGHLAYESEIVVRPGEDELLAATLIAAPPPPAPPPLPPWVFWSTAGASVASAAVAGVFGLRMRDAEASHETLANSEGTIRGEELARLSDEASEHADVANALLITAGGFAVAAAVEIFLTDW